MANPLSNPPIRKDLGMYLPRREEMKSSFFMDARIRGAAGVQGGRPSSQNQKLLQCFRGMDHSTNCQTSDGSRHRRVVLRTDSPSIL
jgi:hypothetical protein